ncbi:hypothetical protein [Bacillus cereus]|nr:hypothetical protein [Bacillus cereus]
MERGKQETAKSNSYFWAGGYKVKPKFLYSCESRGTVPMKG